MVPGRLANFGVPGADGPLRLMILLVRLTSESGVWLN